MFLQTAVLTAHTAVCSPLSSTTPALTFIIKQIRQRNTFNPLIHCESLLFSNVLWHYVLCFIHFTPSDPLSLQAQGAYSLCFLYIGGFWCFDWSNLQYDWGKFDWLELAASFSWNLILWPNRVININNLFPTLYSLSCPIYWVSFFVEKQKLTKVLFDTVCNAALQLKPAKPEDHPYIRI